MATRAALAVGAASALLLLLLSACATPTDTPAGLTDAQLATLAQPIIDAQWRAVQSSVGDVARPVVEREDFVSPHAQVTAVANCLHSNGFSTDTAMVVSADGTIVQTAPILDQVGFRLMQYECEARFPVDPRYYGALSVAQLNYLYDYYVHFTVPCLNANDYPVLVLPTRAEFVDSPTPLWTPYFDPSAAGGIVPPNVLRGRCGVAPAGLFPAEYVASLSDGQDRVNGWGRYGAK